MRVKIVFFNLPGASGHINPTIGIVSELVRLGIHVIYYAGEDSRVKFESLGAEFRNYEKWFHYHHNAETGTDIISMALEELSMTEACIDDLLVELKEDNIKAIVYDACCPWGKYLSESLQVPGINIVTTIVSSPWLIISDWHISKMILGILVRYSFTLIPSAAGRLKAILQRIGAPYRNIFYHVFDFFASVGETNIVFNTERYQPFSNRLSGEFEYVGASIFDTRDVVHSEFRQFEQIESKPLIYISLGSLHNQRPEFYQTCIDAFRDSSVEVVISIGKQLKVSQFRNVPKHIHLYNHVPQIYVLKHTDLFITHGGMNSFNEGLANGVPLLVCPQQFEQEFNGRRFAKMGVAKYFKLGESITASKIRANVQNILDNPVYQQNAMDYQQELLDCGGYRKAAEIIYKNCLEHIEPSDLSVPMADQEKREIA